MGSGTSHGIPVAGCRCSVCQSVDRRDTRYRASLLIEGCAGETIVIDCGPEFRLQLIRAGVTHLDALLITHTHADHLHGLDDVRPFTYEKALNVYTSSTALREISERFPYIIKGAAQEGGGIPKIMFHAAAETIAIGSICVTPLKIKHGILDILGWKISETTAAAGTVSAVYITDASEVCVETRHLAAGCQTLIVGSLRAAAHATHFSFEQAMDFSAELAECAALMKKAPLRNVFLTHICHNHAHKEIIAYCTAWREKKGLDMNVAPAYDGLEIVL